MMKLEDQVCSLELAKRLKELGVKQESLFYWCTHEQEFSKEENKCYNEISLYINKEYPSFRAFGKNESDYLQVGGCGCCAEYYDTLESYSAFTVAEFGELFPVWVMTVFNGDKWVGGWDETRWPDLKGKLKTYSHTEADVRAEILIYLLENGLMKNE